MTVQAIQPSEPAEHNCDQCPAQLGATCTMVGADLESDFCSEKSALGTPDPLTKNPRWWWLTFALALPLGLALVAFQVGPMAHDGLQLQTGLWALSIIFLIGWLLARDRLLTKHNTIARAIDQERINALAKAESSARLASKAADAAAIAKTNLVANMSHEIRTPMNGVIGFAQLLLSTKLSNEQRKYAELILESGDSMVELLNDILDLAKIESGKMEVRSQATNLRDLVTSASSMMKAAARRKGLELNVNISDELPRELMLDGLRVKQVLSNLIGNAIKFTEQGSIEVGLKAVDVGPEKLLEIRVSDTGIGIAPEWQSVIFEQFVQADDSSQRSHGGSGLGLPISRKLAQLMSGTLALESSEGEGTQIALRIPFEKPQLTRGKCEDVA